MIGKENLVGKQKRFLAIIDSIVDHRQNDHYKPRICSFITANNSWT